MLKLEWFWGLNMGLANMRFLSSICFFFELIAEFIS